MCWSAEASLAIGVAGVTTAAVVAAKGKHRGFSLALFYFSLMEFIQFFSYPYIGQCGLATNQMLTYVSYAHIAFQPLFFNLLYLDTMGKVVTARARRYVYAACGVFSLLLVLKVLPLSASAALCHVGQTLCGPLWCTLEGSWHLAWQMPYYLWPLPGDILIYYVVAVFILPLFYGAWRGVLLALIGPVLAYAISQDPHEWPAIWCLFSVALILVLAAGQKILQRLFPQMSE